MKLILPLLITLMFISGCTTKKSPSTLDKVEKLASVRITEVSFSEAPLVEVIEKLKSEWRLSTGTELPVSIIIKDQSVLHPVTAKFVDISYLDTLEYICESSSAGIQYGDSGIVIIQQEFYYGRKSHLKYEWTEDFAESLDLGFNSTNEEIVEMLKSNGADFSPHSIQVGCLPQFNSLLIIGDESDIKLIDSIIKLRRDGYEIKK